MVTNVKCHVSILLIKMFKLIKNIIFLIGKYYLESHEIHIQRFHIGYGRYFRYLYI